MLMTNPANIIYEQSDEKSPTNSLHGPQPLKLKTINVHVNPISQDFDIKPSLGIKTHPRKTNVIASDLINQTKDLQPSSKAIDLVLSSNIIDSTIQSPRNDNDNIITIPSSPAYHPKISYREMENYYLSLFLSNGNDTVPDNSNSSKLCCIYSLIYKLNSKYTLKQELINERDFFLFLNRIYLNTQEDFHLDIIHTIFDALYKDESNQDTPTPYSIEEILSMLNATDKTLFKLTPQDNTKITILQLMQIIALIDKHITFINVNISKFINELSRINYFFFLIKRLSDISVQTVKNIKMTVYFNQKKSVAIIMEEFCYGMLEMAILKLDAILAQTPNKQINNTDIEAIVAEISKISQDMPSSILWKHKIFIEQYPEQKDSVTFTSMEQME